MNNVFVIAEVKKLSTPILGTVEEAIASDRAGRVKCDGTYWPARFYNSDYQVTVKPDEPVKVVAIQGITLLVVPAGSTVI